MSRRRWVRFVFLAFACTSLSGCFWSKKPKPVQVPNPPPPAPAAAQNPTKKASSPPRKRVEPPPPPAPGNSTPPSPTGVSPKQLGQILTPQERTQLTKSLDQSLSAARAALSQVGARTLLREQADTMNLIKALMARAEAARANDLSVAVELARRAELLARDLSNSPR